MPDLIWRALFVAAGCSFLYAGLFATTLPTRLDAWERLFKTDSAVNFEFHRVVDDPHGRGLRLPGFVLIRQFADAE